ncbi:hypothetical protein SRHO_G00201030 [Serrasalmus rhombeus]
MLLIVFIILTAAWMVFYKAHMCRQMEAMSCKDMHAGPMWLRVKGIQAQPDFHVPHQLLHRPSPPAPVLEEDAAEGDLCLPAAL